MNNPNGNVWSSRFSKWSPADGREVPSSGFLRATSQTRLPDLRGMFLRGLNSFDPEQSSTVASERRDPNNRNRGEFQPDVFARHNHGGGDHSHKTGLFNGAVTEFNKPVFRTEANENSAPTQSSGEIIQTQGSDETRPKNVAIFYYIRIN